MLMEGSSLGRLAPDQGFPTEQDIEARLADAFSAPGFVGVCASAQNIDRMVSIYRACKRTGRTLVLDLYAAEVLAATGNPNIPQAGWPNVAIYVRVSAAACQADRALRPDGAIQRTEFSARRWRRWRHGP